MNRTQRRVHAVVWLVLGPVVLAGLVLVALAGRGGW